MLLNRLCKITFIAHGATIYSEEERLTDVESFPPLNDAGKDEIESICKFLIKRGIKNNKIYSSNGIRTIESAEMIAKVYKSNVEILTELTPRKLGKWNNLTMENIFKKRTAEFESFINNPNIAPCENAESLSEFTKRTGKFIEKLVKENIGSRLIIVTYPEVIQAAIVYALDLKREKAANFFIKTGSITQISYYDNFNSLKYSGFVPIE